MVETMQNTIAVLYHWYTVLADIFNWYFVIFIRSFIRKNYI